MNTRIRFARLAALLVVAMMASIGQTWAQQSKQVRLRARQDKAINGIEAELRGDYRESSAPIRLNAELEEINIPVGTPVAFCLLQNGVKTKIGVDQVAMVVGIPTASVELSANDGDTVPKVNAGDVVQAHQSKKAPFKTNPGCGSPLLVSAAFQ